MGSWETEHAIALDAAKLAIATRIKHVCGIFPKAEFDALVTRMAEIDVRYRLRDDWAPYRDPRRNARAALS